MIVLFFLSSYAIYYAVVYCTALHYTAMFFAVLNCTVTCCAVLCCAALYCTVLYSAVESNTFQYVTVQYFLAIFRVTSDLYQTDSPHSVLLVLFPLSFYQFTCCILLSSLLKAKSELVDCFCSGCITEIDLFPSF